VMISVYDEERGDAKILVGNHQDTGLRAKVSRPHKIRPSDI